MKKICIISILAAIAIFVLNVMPTPVSVLPISMLPAYAAILASSLAFIFTFLFKAVLKQDTLSD